jgi:hypothetical protein
MQDDDPYRRWVCGIGPHQLHAFGSPDSFGFGDHRPPRRLGEVGNRGQRHRDSRESWPGCFRSWSRAVQRDGPEGPNGDDGSSRTADNLHAASVGGIPRLIRCWNVTGGCYRYVDGLKATTDRKVPIISRDLPPMALWRPFVKFSTSVAVRSVECKPCWKRSIFQNDTTRPSRSMA